MRKLTALVAAAALAFTSLAPAIADARDGRGRGYDNRHYDGGYDRRHHRRHDDDNGDALAAGAVGLVLGLALGSLATSRQQPRSDAHCYDNYRRCAPPQGYYAPPQRYYAPQPSYYGGSAYEQDYAPPQSYYAPPRSQCTRRERQWDRYANRYVMVDVPC